MSKLFKSLKAEGLKSFDKYFDEEFDIDIEMEQYERIEVPDFSHGRKGRFIHDFSAVYYLLA
jgi:putative uncharacterized protein (fragment)